MSSQSIKVGMVGFDTSHAVEFTRIFQQFEATQPDTVIKVVAGFPGGSDLPISQQRVPEFTTQMKELGVEIVHDIDSLLDRVDALMLESVDGEVHLEQAQQVMSAGKPIFIDKPLANSVDAAFEILRLSNEHSVPCFSASCFRFSSNLLDTIDNSEIGEIISAETWGPCHLPTGVPDLFFYGLHGIEALYTLMGSGCQEVVRTHTAKADVMSGIWPNDRIGTYRGLRGGSLDFGATVFGSKRTVTIELGIPYRELCTAIAKFFRSGIAPVPLQETIEILRFMEAANRSKQTGTPNPLL